MPVRNFLCTFFSKILPYISLGIGIYSLKISMNEIIAKVEFEKIKINELQAKLNELEKINTINKNSNSQVSELINKKLQNI
jgi:hypothetical protein